MAKKIITIVIGLLFLTSGVLKAVDSYSFSVLFAKYGFDFLSYLAPLLSAVEIAIGICLVLFVKPRQILLTAVYLTAAFTVVFAYAYFFRNVKDCGCFGTFAKNIPPYISFIRNILIIAGGLWAAKKWKEEILPSSTWKTAIVLTIGALGFCLAGYTVSTPLVKDTSNPLTDLIGKDLSQTSLSPYYESIKSGRQGIFIFSPTCNHCWNVTANINSLIEYGIVEKVTGVTFMSSLKDTANYKQDFNARFDIKGVKNIELAKLVKEIPVLIISENGIVKEVYSSSNIPAGQTLKYKLGGTPGQLNISPVAEKVD